MKNFDIFSRYCKYGYWSYNEDHIAEWTCHNPDNKPQGCSWGECTKEACPIMAEIREKEKENEYESS